MPVQSFSEAEIERFRAETSGTSRVTHFNNAGASLPTDIVVKTIGGYLLEEALFGGYETEAKYRPQLDNIYSLIAQLIHANENEIALVENASAAWDLSFHGMNLQPGDEVITSEMEYASNVLGLLSAQQRGVIVKVIHNDMDGNFPLHALEAAISSRTKLIAVTHVPSTAGNILPVEKIGALAREHGITYLLDACQSAGQIPLDVEAIGCDLMAVTGRKFLRGPRGTGFLYVRKAMQDKLKLLQMDGFTVGLMTQQGFVVRDDARRFEWHEKNHAVTLGFSKAVEYAMGVGVERIWQHIQYISAYLRTKLGAIQGITVHDRGDELCGIVTFSVAGFDAAHVKEACALRHINVSIGLVKSTLYYMNRKELGDIVRASVHYYITEADVDLLCGVIEEMI